MKTYVTYHGIYHRPWAMRVAEDRLARIPGMEVMAPFISLKELSPRYIFWLHWSERVRSDMISEFECVNFHLGDVPDGRGGSPLQNLIGRGKTETVLSALRMTDGIDDGPVYCKRPISLHGSAEEIYLRTMNLAADIIQWMIREEPTPVPQDGPPRVYKRRKPEDSRVGEYTLPRLFDLIRMMDAEGYPSAFIEANGFRFEFKRAALRTGRIEASVTITGGKE